MNLKPVDCCQSCVGAYAVPAHTIALTSRHPVSRRTRREQHLREGYGGVHEMSRMLIAPMFKQALLGGLVLGRVQLGHAPRSTIAPVGGILDWWYESSDQKFMEDLRTSRQSRLDASTTLSQEQYDRLSALNNVDPYETMRAQGDTVNRAFGEGAEEGLQNLESGIAKTGQYIGQTTGRIVGATTKAGARAVWDVIPKEVLILAGLAGAAYLYFQYRRLKS